MEWVEAPDSFFFSPLKAKKVRESHDPLDTERLPFWFQVAILNLYFALPIFQEFSPTKPLSLSYMKFGKHVYHVETRKKVWESYDPKDTEKLRFGLKEMFGVILAEMWLSQEKEIQGPKRKSSVYMTTCAFFLSPRFSFPVFHHTSCCVSVMQQFDTIRGEEEEWPEGCLLEWQDGTGARKVTVKYGEAGSGRGRNRWHKFFFSPTCLSM